MKRLVALFLALCLLIPAAAVRADGFNMSTFADANTIFDIEVDSTSGVAFIETKLSTSALAYTHKYESQFRYSSLRNDILVLDYFKSSQRPVLRTWITYCADKPLNIYAVSFKYDGKTYTFTEVSDKDWIQNDDSGTLEQVLIKYGDNNTDFLVAIATAASRYVLSGFEDESQTRVVPDMKMILHGTENIEVDVPAGFWTDLGAFVLTMISDESLGSLMDHGEGNPCKVTTD